MFESTFLALLLNMFNTLTLMLTTYSMDSIIIYSSIVGYGMYEFIRYIEVIETPYYNIIHLIYNEEYDTLIILLLYAVLECFVYVALFEILHVTMFVLFVIGANMCKPFIIDKLEKRIVHYLDKNGWLK